MRIALLMSILIIVFHFMPTVYGHRNSAFELTPEQLKAQKAKAYNLDKDAAYKVYTYFNFCFIHNPERYRWLLLARELGQPKAINHYKFLEKEKKFSSKILPQNAFELTEPQIKRYKQQSDKDNGAAAYWLYLYYHYARNNSTRADQWLKISLDKKFPLTVKGIFIESEEFVVPVMRGMIDKLKSLPDSVKETVGVVKNISIYKKTTRDKAISIMREKLRRNKAYPIILQERIGGAYPYQCVLIASNFILYVKQSFRSEWKIIEKKSSPDDPEIKNIYSMALSLKSFKGNASVYGDDVQVSLITIWKDRNVYNYFAVFGQAFFCIRSLKKAEKSKDELKEIKTLRDLCMEMFKTGAPQKDQ